MRVCDWFLMAMTILLLLADIVLSQVCGSLITLLDGFHTFFVLMHMLLRVAEEKVENGPGPSEGSTVPSSSSPSNLPQSETISPGPDSGNTGRGPSKGPPLMHSCGLVYPHTRIRAVGTFLSALFLLSFCLASLLDVVKLILEPHRVHYPLLLVVVGTLSLVHNLVVLVLNWNQIPVSTQMECEAYIEENREALDGEAKQDLDGSHQVQADLGQVDNYLHNEALVFRNQTALEESEVRAQNTEELKHRSNGGSLTSPVQQTSEDFSGRCLPETETFSSKSAERLLCLPALLLVNQSLLTSLLALGNGLVMLLADRHCHWSSCNLLAYLDPSVSVLAVILLLASVKPQLHRYGLLLLQATPPHLSTADLENRIADVKGVQAVHKLHVWELADSLTVASVHVKCHDQEVQEYRLGDLLSEVTRVLKSVGVTCCTVQPEFFDASACPPAESDAASPESHKEETSTSTCLNGCEQTCGGK